MREMTMQPRFTLTRSGSPRRRRFNRDRRMRIALALFACTVQAVSAFVVLALFCLQGFHTLGFHLDDCLMHWLAASVIGNVCSLSLVVYRAYFALEGDMHREVTN